MAVLRLKRLGPSQKGPCNGTVTETFTSTYSIKFLFFKVKNVSSLSNILKGNFYHPEW